MTETEVAMTASGAWFPQDFDYNADRDWLRHSHLEVFRDSIPTYHGRYVAKTLPDRKETEALRFGTWAHEWFFGKGSGAFLVLPKIDGRTKLGKELNKQNAERAKASDLILISEEDRGLLAGMHKAALASEGAALLKESGIVESPFHWTDPISGIGCKAKPDKFFPESSIGGRVMMDLKTADNPSPEAFRRDMANYGYHRQAAFYIEGGKIAFDFGYVQFLFLVIGKKPPHETIVYELHPQALKDGRLENQSLLIDLAECRASGNWTGRWSSEPQMIGLPKWYV